LAYYLASHPPSPEAHNSLENSARLVFDKDLRHNFEPKGEIKSKVNFFQI
jgi:hypothetical protein